MYETEFASNCFIANLGANAILGVSLACAVGASKFEVFCLFRVNKFFREFHYTNILEICTGTVASNYLCQRSILSMEEFMQATNYLSKNS